MSAFSRGGTTNHGLVDLILKYDADLEQVEQNLTLRGKTLEVALKEQATWPNYYSSRRAEIKILMKYWDAQVSKVRGELARRYVENYSRQLGERVMSQYIDAEQSYLSMYQLYLQVEELYSKYDAVVDAFDKRGFALRDLTAARIHEIESADL